MAINKEKINHLINHLSEKDLSLIAELMERLAFENKFKDISLDDEITTQDDLDAIKAAHEAYKKGELIDLEDIDDELQNCH